MKHLLPVLQLGIASLTGLCAHGQTIVLTDSSTYTQNFDTLSAIAGSTTNTFALAGWHLTETGGGARDNEQYATSDGGSNTGDTYSFGAAGSSERALGGLRSGTLIPSFGAAFKNGTGFTITELAFAYTGEQWRLGTAARIDRLIFEYSLNAKDLTTGDWTGVADLNFVAPSTTTTGTKNGNAAANRTFLSSSVDGLALAHGSTIWVRWVDQDATGADDGLAVDDVTVTPTIIPEPSTYALIIGALTLGLAALRRRNAR